MKDKKQKKVPKCKGCTKPDDKTRFACFFTSTVHPATLIEENLPDDWYKEFDKPKPYCLIKCLVNKCKKVIEL